MHMRFLYAGKLATYKQLKGGLYIVDGAHT